MKLTDSRNFVTIFNGLKKTPCKKRGMLMFGDEEQSHKKYANMRKKKAPNAEVLQRVKTFLAPWFASVKRKLTSLKLLHPPRRTSGVLMLVSRAGCRAQKRHWDYDPALVQPIIKAKKYIGVPLSVFVSFTPTGSKLEVVDVDGIPTFVPIPFGSMMVITGDVLHAGCAYDEPNLRGFMHVEHDMCLFQEDEVHLATHRTKNPLPVSPPPAAGHQTPVSTAAKSIDLATPVPIATLVPDTQKAGWRSRTLGTRRKKNKSTKKNTDSESITTQTQIIRDGILARQLDKHDV